MILRRLSDAIHKQNWFTVAVEFVIVVVGIFVGLQIDAWNNVRNDRALEQEYLLRLADDTKWNIDNFLELEIIFDAKASFITALRDSPASLIAASDAEAFISNLDYSTWFALPAVRTATFSELESSGRISLIQDVSLRGELSIFFANYALMQGILDEPIGEYRRLVHSSIPGDISYKWQLEREMTDLDAVLEALEELQSDPVFPRAANAEIAYAGAMNFWLRHHREIAEDILNRIENSRTQ